MIPQELEALFPHLPPGTEVWLVRIRLPGSSADIGDRQASHEVERGDPADEGPGEPLKVDAASRESGIPARELRRAMQNGFLSYRVKERGRDAGAHLITPADLDEYRQRRVRVRTGAEPKPENWPDPVRSPHEY